MLIGVAFFCPNEVTNRTHSRGYVEDSRAQTGGERCTKMTVLSLSVLP
ncbi:secretion protein HlyD [uncultured Selenomonas sp.]|nr:secretion protein HlyD [uncultured Selenomonas sp.]